MACSRAQSCSFGGSILYKTPCSVSSDLTLHSSVPRCPRRRRSRVFGSDFSRLSASTSAAVSPSAASSSLSPSSSTSSSFPEGVTLVDAGELRKGGSIVISDEISVVSLNSLVLVPIEDEEVDASTDVAIAVVAAEEALDLRAAASALGWTKGAKLAPRVLVPELLGFRFAPGGVPPLYHGLERTLVCSRLVEVNESDDDETLFVAGGGDPTLRLVFRGKKALRRAFLGGGGGQGKETTAAVAVAGLGVERPAVVLPPPPPPPRPTTTEAAEEEDAGAEVTAGAASPGSLPLYEPPPPLFVDDATGVRAAAEVLLPPRKEKRHENVSCSSSPPEPKNSNRQRWHFLGFDAEWLPERERGSVGRQPLQTLQLATRDAAVVFDVAAISRNREASEALVELLARAATAGTDKDDDGERSVLFVGHSAKQDLLRLARTIQDASSARGEGAGPGSTGERGATSLPPLVVPPLPIHSVDLPPLARWAVSPPRAVVPAGKLPGGHGLASLVELFLRRKLPKDGLQTSDWGHRPLSPGQIRYAASDAHACVAIVERIAELRPELISTRKRAAAHSGGVNELDGGSSRKRDGRGRGGGRGGKLFPSVKLAPGPARDARRAAKEDWKSMMALSGEDNSSSSSFASSNSDPSPFPRPVSSSSSGTAADFDADVPKLMRGFLGLPLPGKGGRGAAVAAALGLSGTSGGGAVAVPRFERGGVAKLRNAVVLFVNFDADGGRVSNYPNEFLLDSDIDGGEGKDGKVGGNCLRMTWFPSPGQGPSHPLVRKLLSPSPRPSTASDNPGEEEQNPHSVLLFCRLRGARATGPYHFMGRVGDPLVDWGQGGDGDGDDEEKQKRLELLRGRGYRPPVFAWKLLDVDDAFARGGRGVASILDAGRARAVVAKVAKAASERRESREEKPPL